MTLPQHNSPIDAYFDKVSQGRVPGASVEIKFGRSMAVNSTESVVWDHGGNYTFIEAAEYLSIVSDDADDNPLSTGAHTMLVQGLDENYDPFSEVITLTGLTPVITKVKAIRTYRMFILTSGTNDPILDANEGTITATTVITEVIQAKMLPRNGQTLMMVYTIPRGFSALAQTMQASVGKGNSCLIKTKLRNGPSPEGALTVKLVADVYQSTFFWDFKISRLIPEMTDIVFTAQTGAGLTITLSLFLGMILYDNNVIDLNPA